MTTAWVITLIMFLAALVPIVRPAASVRKPEDNTPAAVRQFGILRLISASLLALGLLGVLP